MNRRRPLIPAVALALLWSVALSADPPATMPAAKPGAASLPAGKSDPVGPADASEATPKLTKGPAVEDLPDPFSPKVTIDSPSIQSAVKLSLQNRLLHLTTDLPFADEPVSVKIADFPGKTIAVVSNQHDLPVITIRHEISAPPDSTIIYTISSLQNDVRLAVDSETSGQMRSVQYIQNSRSDGTDPDNMPVTLYASVIDKNTSAKSVDLKLQADDVVQLRRKYPRETAEYLQPMLAALGQETVAFAVDPRTAWQVLRVQFAIDPGTAAQVKKLVAQLDADDYAAREAASESLEKLGEPAALIAMQMPRTALSSEQNSRLDAFLAPYKPLTETDAKTLATDVPFLLDCLYTDDVAIRNVAIEQLRNLTSQPIAPKTDAAPAAWLASVHQLRKQLLAGPTTKRS